MRWIHSQAFEHANRIELRGRLHQACQHDLLEHLVLDDPEAQSRIRSSQRGPEHVTGGPHHANTAGPSCSGRARWSRSSRDERGLSLCGSGRRGIRLRAHAQIERLLLALENLAAPLDQQCDLDRAMARADVLDDLKLPVPLSDDLDRSRSRPGPHLPHERHPVSIPKRSPEPANHQFSAT